MKLFILLISIFLLFPFNRVLAQKQPPRIAVLNLKPAGITEEESLTLSDRLRSELVKTKAFILIERSEMDEILKEQGFQLSGCTSDECAVQAGRLLNVQQICAGSVGKIGRLYSVSVRLIDVQTGQVLKTVSEDCPCPIEAVLTRAMRNVALKLAGKIQPEASSPIYAQEGTQLIVKSFPAGAFVLIDKKPFGQTPQTIDHLTAGKHTIVIEKEGFAPIKHTIALSAGQTFTVNDTLKAFAELLIVSQPDGAEVWLNDQKKGKTPLHLKIPPKKPVGIRIIKSGFLPREQTVTLNAGTFKEMTVTLKAQPAHLIFSGLPPGSNVIINDRQTALKEARLTLSPGQYHLEIKKSGFCKQKLTVRLNAGETKTIEVALQPKTTKAALLRSLLFPGWGQKYQEKKGRSLLFGIGFLASGLAAYYYDRQFNSSRDQYDNIRADYHRAFSLQKIEMLREQMHRKYDEVASFNSKRNVFLGVAAGIWLWNVLDAVLLPPNWTSRNVKVIGNVSGQRAVVGLGLRW